MHWPTPAGLRVDAQCFEALAASLAPGLPGLPKAFSSLLLSTKTLTWQVGWNHPGFPHTGKLTKFDLMFVIPSPVGCSTVESRWETSNAVQLAVQVAALPQAADASSLEQLCPKGACFGSVPACPSPKSMESLALETKLLVRICLLSLLSKGLCSGVIGWPAGAPDSAFPCSTWQSRETALRMVSAAAGNKTPDFQFRPLAARKA